MKKLALFTLFAVFAATVSFAKGYAFKVLISKGNVEVHKGTHWHPVKSAEEIQHVSKIRVSDGGYIGLMHTSGRTMELKEGGTYNVADLEKSLTSGGSGFTSKYMEFIADNMITNDERVVTYDVTGSVTRGASEVTLMSPKQFKVVKDLSFEVSWISDTTRDYEVSVNNLYGDVLWSKDVHGDRVVVDIDLLNLEYTEIYTLKVSRKDQPSIKGQTPFSLASAEEENSLYLDLDKLNKSIDDSSSLDKVMIASFFDQNDLPIYALSSLNRAEDLSPGNEEFGKIKENYYYTVCQEVDR